MKLCFMSILFAIFSASVTILTSGEEILTFLAFSVRIFSSSTYDSRKRVYVKVSVVLAPVLWATVTYLHVVFGELFGKRAAASSGRIHSVIDRNLAILVVKPSIDVLTTLLQDFLAEHD